jgi:phosphoglucosamine mutase
MGRHFGTDGIRGVADVDLTAELAVAVGRAVGVACSDGTLGSSRHPRVVVGRDTRPSGPMLEAAVVAGLCSGGADVALAGVIPTPGVAFLVGDLGADAGVVISASHNPAADNGIKVFGTAGWKLDPATEDVLESLIDRAAPRGAPGRFEALDDGLDRYVAHLVDSVAEDLKGMRVVVDCARGAAFEAAPLALRRAGLDVTAIHASPDGRRINEGCGATVPDVVAAAAKGAIGLALDGDADRVLASDEDGRIVDGDAIIAMLATDARRHGQLPGDAIAVTVMANQSLRTWASARGVTLVETPVGDRHVLAAMREGGLVLGGEQSGHVIRLQHATTGDGILTALGLLDAVAATGGRLADAVPFRPLPQSLLNVAVRGRDGLKGATAVWDEVGRAEWELGAAGRVLVRASGTEPLVRVMVEAPSQHDADEIARRIAAVVARELS